MFSTMVSDVIMRSVLLCIQSFTGRAEQKVLWFMSVWSFLPTPAVRSVCVLISLSCCTVRGFLLYQKHTDRPDQSVASLLWSTNDPQHVHTLMYTSSPKCPVMILCSDIHTTTLTLMKQPSGAIWGSASCPRTQIEPSTCWLERRSALPPESHPAQRRGGFLKNSVLKRQTLKMSVFKATLLCAEIGIFCDLTQRNTLLALPCD